MYSKKERRNSLPPRMPEHYSGWAFQPPSANGDRPPKFEEKPSVTEPPRGPVPEIHHSFPRQLPFLPPPGSPKEPPKKEPPLPIFPPSMEHLFENGGLLGRLNLDFEELLLIGLIILLASGGEDSELTLLLALLLLC